LSGDARRWPRLERLWRRSGRAGRKEERVRRRGGPVTGGGARTTRLPDPPRGHLRGGLSRARLGRARRHGTSRGPEASPQAVRWVASLPVSRAPSMSSP
jgi:hypothetical protein